MAYSGQTKVMPFIAANHAGRLTIANTGIDISITGADAATLIVPIPLIILTVRHVQSSSVAGEVAPFIVARWLQPDFSSTEQWTDIT